MSDAGSWVASPDRFELGDVEVHVWRASLNVGENLLRQMESTLVPDELARANRFHFQRDRNNFVAARGVLRDLLGRYLDRPPAELELEYGSRGKPSLRATSLNPPISFNVSHSHGLALLAFSPKRAVGVDVELIRGEFAGEEIAERYFSPREVAELNELPPASRAEGFFLCWTRKEAYIKARGEGLHIPLDSFHVSLTPGRPVSLQSADSSRWRLCSLRPDQQYAAALVGEGNDWQLRCWNWRPLTDG